MFVRAAVLAALGSTLFCILSLLSDADAASGFGSLAFQTLPTSSSFRSGLMGLQSRGSRGLSCPLRRGGGVVACRMSGGMAIPNEDDWYDSDKWRKSGARMQDPYAKRVEQERSKEEEKTKAGEQVGEEKRGPSGWSDEVQWLKVGGSDVCLPKDTKKPLDGSPRFNALVHFVGGVFVGTIPKAAYQPFIEAVVHKGRVVVVATPCTALSGMDHYKAAYEAAFKFTSACDALQGELGREVFDPDMLPTIGVGHSLGCKIHLLLNSVADAREAAGRPRTCNVHVAFNNFGAKESIPVLSQLGDLQRTIGAGIAGAVPVIDRVTSFANDIKNNAEFKDVLGTPGAAKALDALEMLSKAGKAAAANLQEEPAEEFSPSPDDTLRLLDAEYCVSRNLVVKFEEDDIDQSIPLCQALRRKFTDAETGEGGRLDLRRLPGTHVTPNVPDLQDVATRGTAGFQGLDLGEGMEDEAQKQAIRVMQEMEGLADVVAAFVKEESIAEGFAPRSRKQVSGADA